MTEDHDGWLVPTVPGVEGTAGTYRDFIAGPNTYEKKIAGRWRGDQANWMVNMSHIDNAGKGRHRKKVF